MIRLTLMSLLLVTAASAAAEPGRQDFAWRWSLTPAPDSPIYRVPLTREVYRALNRGDAADVLISDADGRPVPFASLTPGLLRETRREAIALDFSTRFHRRDNTTARPELELQHQDTRLIVRSRADARPDDAPGRLLFEALAAAPAAPDESPDLPVQKLAFSFLSDRQARLDCRVRASDSDEPAHTRLDLQPAADTRPLRLRGEVAAPMAENAPAGWHLACYGNELPSDFRLESVTLATEGVISHRRWHELTPEPVAEPEQPGVHGFELDGPYIVERITLKARQANVITSVQVRSRRDPSSPWRQRGRATLSNLEFAADDSLSIALEGDHRDRFWQITSQPALDRPPAVELRARAEELAFLAQGEGPWQLYAGGRQASQHRSGRQAARRGCQQARPSLAMAAGSAPRPPGSGGRSGPARTARVPALATHSLVGHSGRRRNRAGDHGSPPAAARLTEHLYGLVPGLGLGAIEELAPSMSPLGRVRSLTRLLHCSTRRIPADG